MAWKMYIPKQESSRARMVRFCDYCKIKLDRSEQLEPHILAATCSRECAEKYVEIFRFSKNPLAVLLDKENKRTPLRRILAKAMSTVRKSDLSCVKIKEQQE